MNEEPTKFTTPQIIVDPKTDLKSDATRHISQQVYMVSEEFNALRKELYDNWRAEPASFAGANGQALWYYSGLMATNPQAFVEIMSMELGEPIQFDSHNEAGICLQILNGLRKKRGVGAV